MIDFRDWYTDTMDIYRVTAAVTGHLTRHSRALVAEAIPCRLYHTGAPELRMGQTAASVEQRDWVQCDNAVEVRSGDELRIHRGAGLGQTAEEIRAFAADPEHYYEPFGAALPGLAHQEIRLLQKEWAK